MTWHVMWHVSFGLCYALCAMCDVICSMTWHGLCSMHCHAMDALAREHALSSSPEITCQSSPTSFSMCVMLFVLAFASLVLSDPAADLSATTTALM